VVWNSDKKYLTQIQEKGFRIVPTNFFEKQNPLDLAPSFDSFKSDKLVFKPTVSGGSKNTLKLEKNSWELQKEKLESLLENEDFMVQPFIKEVV
jgi:glutathione synthase/RimK-type ligase-like ATP-grasp enzyme